MGCILTTLGSRSFGSLARWLALSLSLSLCLSVTLSLCLSLSLSLSVYLWVSLCFSVSLPDPPLPFLLLGPFLPHSFLLLYFHAFHGTPVNVETLKAMGHQRFKSDCIGEAGRKTLVAYSIHNMRKKTIKLFQHQHRNANISLS